jgi:hypothetical protein
MRRGGEDSGPCRWDARLGARGRARRGVARRGRGRAGSWLTALGRPPAHSQGAHPPHFGAFVHGLSMARSSAQAGSTRGFGLAPKVERTEELIAHATLNVWGGVCPRVQHTRRSQT